MLRSESDGPAFTAVPPPPTLLANAVRPKFSEAAESTPAERGDIGVSGDVVESRAETTPDGMANLLRQVRKASLGVDSPTTPATFAMLCKPVSTSTKRSSDRLVAIKKDKAAKVAGQAISIIPYTDLSCRVLASESVNVETLRAGGARIGASPAALGC